MYSGEFFLGDHGITIFGPRCAHLSLIVRQRCIVIQQVVCVREPMLLSKIRIASNGAL
jgi:hypothetical protein